MFNAGVDWSTSEALYKVECPWSLIIESHLVWCFSCSLFWSWRVVSSEFCQSPVFVVADAGLVVVSCEAVVIACYNQYRAHLPSGQRLLACFDRCRFLLFPGSASPASSGLSFNLISYCSAVISVIVYSFFAVSSHTYGFCVAGICRHILLLGYTSWLDIPCIC